MTLTVPANPDSAKSYDMASHHHVDCFKLPRKLKHVTITEFVEDYVEVSADVEIPHDEIVKRLEAAAASGGKKKVKREHDENENAAGDLSLMERVVSAADSGDFQAPTKSPATKKVKQEKGRESSSNDDEFARMVQVYKTMPESSMGGLKDELRYVACLLVVTRRIQRMRMLLTFLLSFLAGTSRFSWERGNLFSSKSSMVESMDASVLVRLTRDLSNSMRGTTKRCIAVVALTNRLK